MSNAQTYEEQAERHARTLEAAATLLRRLPRLAAQDGLAHGNTVMSSLAKVTAAERWLRREAVDILDELQDQRIEAATPRTAAAVRALEDAMRDAVDQLPDDPDC